MNNSHTFANVYLTELNFVVSGSSRHDEVGINRRHDNYDKFEEEQLGLQPVVQHSDDVQSSPSHNFNLPGMCTDLIRPLFTHLLHHRSKYLFCHSVVVLLVEFTWSGVDRGCSVECCQLLTRPDLDCK